MTRDEEMASTDRIKVEPAEESRPGSSPADVIPIELRLGDLPSNPEDIREIAESVAFALVRSLDFPEITEEDAEALAYQIEVELIEALATLRFEQYVAEKVSKSFRPVRETLKGIGQFIRGCDHAG